MLLLACVFVPAGLLHKRYRPFRDKSLDFVEAASIMSSITMLLMGGYIQSVNTAGDWNLELDANESWSTAVAATLALLALICFVVVWLNAALNLSREDIVMSDKGNFIRGMMKAVLCCWTKCICSGPSGGRSSYRVSFYLRDLCRCFTMNISDSESDLDEDATDVPLRMQTENASLPSDSPLRTDVRPLPNGSKDGIELIDSSSAQNADRPSDLADVYVDTDTDNESEDRNDDKVAM